jgi:hypothetical protein
MCKPVECGVAEMTDSTQLFKSGQHTELLQRFKDDGYLYGVLCVPVFLSWAPIHPPFCRFLRGIVPLDAVSSSQRKVTRLIDRLGWTKHAKGPAKKGQVGATIEAYSGLVCAAVPFFPPVLAFLTAALAFRTFQERVPTPGHSFESINCCGVKLARLLQWFGRFQARSCKRS